MEIDSTAVVLLLGVVGCVGGIVARDRYISNTIVSGDKAVRDEFDRKLEVMQVEVDKDAAILHERINKTRDEFVRRDDLDGHLSRIEKNIGAMHDEQKGMNKRLDDFMVAMVKKDG